MRETIRTFHGLAPKLEGNLPLGFAVQALDVDVSSGKIQPVRENRYVTAVTGAPSDIILRSGVWQYGTSRYFAPWTYGDLDLLWYLDSGTVKRRVGAGAEDDAGLDKPPDIVSAATGGAGSLTGTYQYVVVHKRVVGGYTDFSQPSDPSAEVVAAAQEIDVQRGAIADPDVTHWWLFRIGSTTGQYEFVAEIAAATATYTDDLEDAELGEGLLTWYTSRQGNQILLTKPPALDGLCPELHYNMLLGWAGATLYASEPNMPDGWDQNVFLRRFPSTIRDVRVIGTGLVAVVTDEAVWRMYGSEPELFRPERALTPLPARAGRGAEGRGGLFYLTPDGVAYFDGTSCSVYSQPEFDRDWFLEHIPAAGSHMSFTDGILRLFHTGGYLQAQHLETKTWTQGSDVCTASWVDPVTRKQYVAIGTGIYELHGSESEYKTWTWRSADMLLGTELNKFFQPIEVQGSGTVTVTAYVDGVLAGGPKTLEWNSERGRRLKLHRARGRALQVELSGTGEVYELAVEGGL